MSQPKQKQKQPSKSQPNKTPKQQNKWLLPVGIIAAIAVAIIVTIFALKGSYNNKTANTNGVVATVKNADLVIPISDISAVAKFYPVEIDGTQLEVFAVKAADGTIRTAFNTCQVCYDSGRGYYEQDGSVLVCQNCGNRFQMNQVEVQSGGCNPVPIFAQNKTVDDENITISKDYLAQAKVIFSNWKTEY
jgi:uncharacterized membrane protein